MRYIFLLTALTLPIFCTFSQTAKELYEKGEFLKNNSRYKEAIAMFEKSASIEPKDHKTQFEIGRSYVGLGRFRQAVMSLEKSTKIKPDFYEAYELLGDLYAAQFRNPQKAALNYDLAFQHNSSIENKLRYKLEIINLLYSYNKHHLAFKHIKDAEEILPDNFDLKFFEAQYYIETEKYDLAKNILEKLVVNIPEKSGNEIYFFEMGRAYFHLADYKKAKVFFKKANNGAYRSKVLIYTPQFFLSIAKVYFAMYEYEFSEDALKIAFDMEEGSTDAFDLKKKIEQVKVDKRKLIEAVKSAIEQEKDKNKLADRYSELALYANQDGNHALAEIACTEYLKFKPLNYEMMFLQAMSLGKMKRHTDAINMLSRMLKNPKVPPQYKAKMNFGLGLIYKNSGDFDKAETAFKDAYSGSSKEASRYELMQIFKLRRKHDEEKSIKKKSKPTQKNTPKNGQKK